jgi:hypothetical protein
MLGHLFYFFGLFILMSIIHQVVTYRKFVNVSDFIKTFKKVTGKPPGKTDYKDKGDFSFMSGYVCMMLLEFFWYFIGILSGNWTVFLGILSVNILYNKLSRVLPNFLKLIFGVIVLTFKASLVLFLVINHFHLHLDIYTWLF